MDKDKRIEELENELADVHADVAIVANALKSTFKELGLSPEDFQGGIASIIPKLMPKLMTIDTSQFSEIKEIIPILKKYEHLIEE